MSESTGATFGVTQLISFLKFNIQIWLNNKLRNSISVINHLRGIRIVVNGDLDLSTIIRIYNTYAVRRT